MLKKLSISDRLAMLLLSTAWLVFFSRTLSTRLVYFLDDLKIIYFPLEWVYADFQQVNQLPLWSRYFGFGHPLLAWGQLGFFTPLHLLLRSLLLHPLTVLQLSILIYFAAGSLGMYIFLRQQKLSAPAASLGSIIFTYAGFHVGHLSHVNFFTATMLLPWLLLALHRLLTRPALLPSLYVALLAAAIALSGQPQVVLYTLAVAGWWFAVTIRPTHKPLPTILWLALAGLLSLSLAAPSILPLAEFLPYTDRAWGLSSDELLEFSYPPSHAITLLFPYLFGDHDYYWGAKNFQELAAYTGIIPLLLLGPAFFSRHRRLLLFGLVLLLTGSLFALGQYSPLYTWLVQAGYIKSLAIPGRFTLFFIVGVAILSPLGLDAIAIRRRRHRLAGLFYSLAIIGLIFIPFTASLFRQPQLLRHFLSAWRWTRPEPTLIIIGLLCCLFFFLRPQRSRRLSLLPWLLPSLAGLTLLVYGWNYNPLTSRSLAYQPSPFAEGLLLSSPTPSQLPRLYHLQHPSVAGRRHTDPISPSFTVIQPITVSASSISCFTMPYQLSSNFSTGTPVLASIHRDLDQPSLSTATIDPSALNGAALKFCFTPISAQPNEQFFLRFSSPGDSGLHLVYQPSVLPHQQAYLIRTPSPSLLQLKQSQKPITILLDQSSEQLADLSAWQLDRHINATASASSANWIGALAIKPYRDFVTALLDDDPDPVHYDSQSILSDRRQIINLSGITHLIEQALTGTDYSYLTSARFTLLDSSTLGNTVMRLYQNLDAYPKAWLVKQAIYSPVDDETINAMRQPSFSPRDLIYISGPTPPKIIASADPQPLDGQVTISRYDDTAIDLDVTSNQLAWLVFNDSTLPAWRTYIDGQPAPYYTAFNLFKAAQVPAGRHLVSFRYESTATDLAVYAAAISLLTIIILFAFSATITSQSATNSP